MRQILVCCILLFVAFYGCAQSTGYVRRNAFLGIEYGYDDKKISDNEYCIIATGNDISTPDHVAKLALYHAAKVTIQNKCKCFQIVKKNEKMLPRHRIQTLDILIPGAGILFIPVGEGTILGSKSILIIRLIGEAEPAAPNHINAQSVVAELDKTFNTQPSYE